MWPTELWESGSRLSSSEIRNKTYLAEVNMHVDWLGHGLPLVFEAPIFSSRGVAERDVIGLRRGAAADTGGLLCPQAADNVWSAHVGLQGSLEKYDDINRR